VLVFICFLFEELTGAELSRITSKFSALPVRRACGAGGLRFDPISANPNPDCVAAHCVLLAGREIGCFEEVNFVCFHLIFLCVFLSISGLVSVGFTNGRPRGRFVLTPK
jgi:hypothetical protein